MNALLTPSRLRAIAADVRTEKDLELTLRAHKIRFSYDTSAGFLSFRVPVRSGAVRIVRTASRSCPFRVFPASPRAVVPVVPVLHPDRY